MPTFDPITIKGDRWPVMTMEACSSSSSYGVPFFTRPFGTMFGSTGGLFGPAGFVAMRSLLLLRPAFERRGVYVQEVLENFEETLESKVSNYQQHTVEHPDDVDNHFENSRMAGHGGLENLCWYSSSPQLGQVHTVIKKGNITCTESNFNTGHLEPPRKQLKS